MKRIVLVAAGAAMLMAGTAATADEMAGRIKSHQAKKLVVTDAQNKDKTFELSRSLLNVATESQNESAFVATARYST